MCYQSNATLGEELLVIMMLLLAMIGHSGVELFTRSLLIGWAGWLALSKVIAPLILLSHTVHQKEDQEDGKQEANHSAGYNRCTKKNNTMSNKNNIKSIISNTHMHLQQRLTATNQMNQNKWNEHRGPVYTWY